MIIRILLKMVKKFGFIFFENLIIMEFYSSKKGAWS